MNEITRREFVKACFLLGAAAIAWDAIANEGHPAYADDETEPP